MNFWLKLRHDVELKKQLVTVALVATAITVLESGYILGGGTPTVQ